ASVWALPMPPVPAALLLAQPLNAALLAGVPENILCFSRSFEDLTCFWDEEEEEASRTCHFYYWYSRDSPRACTVSTWRRGAGGTRHACIFPSQDVRLFTQLHLHVLDITTNQTKYQRELSVDTVGLIAPPVNITARWAGAAGQLYVSWQPPLADYPNFFLYEVRCCPASPPEVPCSTGRGVQGPQLLPSLSPLLQGLVQANTWVVIRDLQPGVRYHIQVRSKPDGTSMDGGSSPLPALALTCPGDIGLSCSTPDLRHLHCEWSWDPAETHSSHQLFYQPSPSGAAPFSSYREDAWQQCLEVSVGVQGTHTCTFQPRAGSAIAILVNITRPHMPPTLSYFKEPFWLHQAVLTDAPQLVQATVSQGRLSLQWLPPLEALAERLDYQVRYAVENSHDWKVLQVPRAARKEVLDLRPGARYHAQVRAQPSGPQYQGSWSAWSEPVVADATADAGKGLGALPGGHQGTPGLGFAFNGPLPAPSNVKQKLWPPVPDLHRALGSFLHESSKHGQVRGPGLGLSTPRLGQLGGQPPPPPPLSAPRPTPSTSSRRRRRKRRRPSCPACWRCSPARGGRRARRPRRRSPLPAGCPAPTSPTSPTCS
uniref:MPL proto-oncogene, thrombopoietin receptor n=1 Tax=Calidris pygmaea TaxID=425635 RepID=A0A8C3K0Q9_9CHAR